MIESYSFDVEAFKALKRINAKLFEEEKKLKKDERRDLANQMHTIISRAVPNFVRNATETPTRVDG